MTRNTQKQAQSRFERLYGQEVNDEAWGKVRRYYLPLVFALFTLVTGFLTNIVAMQFGYTEAIIPISLITIVGLIMGCFAVLHPILVYMYLGGLSAIAFTVLPTKSIWIIFVGLLFVTFNIRRLMQRPFQIGERNPLGTIYYIAKGIYATAFPVPRWLHVEPNFLSGLGAIMAIIAATLIHLHIGWIYVSIFIVGCMYFDVADGIVARRMQIAGHERKSGYLIDKRCDLVAFVALLSAGPLFLPPITFYILLVAFFYDLFKEPMPFLARNTLGKIYLILAMAYPDIRHWAFAALLTLVIPLLNMISNAFFFHTKRKQGELPSYLQRNIIPYPLYFFFWIIAAPVTTILLVVFWGNINGILAFSLPSVVLIITFSHWFTAATLTSTWIYINEYKKYGSIDSPWWFYKEMFSTAILALIWSLCLYIIAEFPEVGYVWAIIAAIVMNIGTLLKEIFIVISICVKAQKRSLNEIAPELSNPQKDVIYILPKSIGSSPMAIVDLFGRIVISKYLLIKLPQDAFHAILKHEFSHSKNLDGLLRVVICMFVTAVIASPLPWVLEALTGEFWFTFGSMAPVVWLWLFGAYRIGIATSGLVQMLCENRADKSVSEKDSLKKAREILMQTRQPHFDKLEKIWCVGLGYPITLPCMPSSLVSVDLQ